MCCTDNLLALLSLGKQRNDIKCGEFPTRCVTCTWLTECIRQAGVKETNLISLKLYMTLHFSHAGSCRQTSCIPRARVARTPTAPTPPPPSALPSTPSTLLASPPPRMTTMRCLKSALRIHVRTYTEDRLMVDCLTKGTYRKCYSIRCYTVNTLLHFATSVAASLQISCSSLTGRAVLALHCVSN